MIRRCVPLYDEDPRPVCGAEYDDRVRVSICPHRLLSTPHGAVGVAADPKYLGENWPETWVNGEKEAPPLAEPPIEVLSGSVTGWPPASNWPTAAEYPCCTPVSVNGRHGHSPTCSSRWGSSHRSATVTPHPFDLALLELARRRSAWSEGDNLASLLEAVDKVLTTVKPHEHVGDDVG